MSRITLIIADKDELYVESLVNFLMSNYSKKFQINSFTKTEFLYKYLSDGANKADILFADPDISLVEIPLNNVKTIIYMASGHGIDEIKGHKAINKYQNAENLVSGIIAAFSEDSDENALSGLEIKKSKVISVYSPVGGIGKTSISMALALNLSASGHKVFYLNMENAPAIASFFKDNNENNMSTILFCIKGKSHNIQAKLEGTKCYDSSSGVYYFNPPDSTFEIEEMQPEELKLFVSLLKSSGQYDFVFIDLSSSITKNNIALLEASDRIVLPIDLEITSEVKLSVFKKELGIQSSQTDINLFEKAVPVINKFTCNNKQYSSIKGIDINDSTIKIPLLYSNKNSEIIKFISHKTGIERLCM